MCGLGHSSNKHNRLPRFFLTDVQSLDASGEIVMSNPVGITQNVLAAFERAHESRTVFFPLSVKPWYLQISQEDHTEHA